MERLSARATRRGRALAVAIAAGALFAPSAAIVTPALARQGPSTPAAAPAAATQADASLARLPIRFEENKGQTDHRADFVARVGGTVVYLTSKGAALSTVRTEPAMGGESAPHKVRETVFMNLAGANAKAKAVGVDKLPGVSSYLSGTSRPTTDVAGYASVRYENVYKGVDLVYRSGPDGLSYDFEVAPGANPDAISLQFDGPANVAVDSDGGLVLGVASGSLRQSRPVTYQDAVAGRRDIGSRFTVDGDHHVRFHVDGYDHSKKLVIDPVLAWSGFLGSNGDSARGVASDGTGLYVAGQAFSLDFPTTAGSFDATGDGEDAFVAKIALSGSSLVYATYLGGTGFDSASAITVDGSGQAFVTGSTTSVDFPTTAGSFDVGKRTLANGITVNGSDLYRASSASFTAADVGKAILSPNVPSGTTITALVSSQSIRISAPATASGSGLTYTIGPLPTGRAFVVRLNSAGSALGFATYLGGGNGDEGRGIAVDGSGRAIVAGMARAAAFPTTPTAFDANRSRSDGASTVDSDVYTSASAAFTSADVGRFITGANIVQDTTVLGVTNATTIQLSAPASGSGTGLSFTLGNHSAGSGFVARLSATGAALEYSTYLAGTGGDAANGLALASGVPVVTGSANSGDFPTTASAFRPAAPGSGDAFVTKVDMSVAGNASGVPSPSNNALVFSTYLGGTDGGESANAVAVDGTGVYVTGATSSTDFPTTPGAPDATCNPFGSGCPGKAFVTKLATNGSSLGYSTYLGGNDGTEGRAIFVDGAGSAYVTGVTSGDTFPTVTPLAFNSGNGDAFLTKMAPAGTSLAYSTYLGGAGSDAGAGVAGDGGSGVFLVGLTDSADLPTTPGVFDATPNGQSAMVAHITAGASPPALRALVPAGGPRDTPIPLVISGAGFTGATRVTYAGTALTFTVNSDSQITATVPESSEGSGPIKVTGPNGTSVVGRTFVVAHGQFATTGSCATECGQLAIALQSGKVLAFTPGASGVANVYNPATGTWAPTGTCPGCGGFVFNNAHLVLLPNGKVLYEGGTTSNRLNPPSKSAFLYDPVAGTWSQTGDMTVGRVGHSATLLTNGKVLVAGGCETQRRGCGPTTGAPASSDVGSVKAELYDPATGLWSATGNLIGARGNHSAVLLDPAVGGCASDCGKVLVAGGFNNGSANTLDTVEMYDPVAATWSSRPNMRQRRALHAAVQVANGRVLEIGGYFGSNATSDEYEPDNVQWAELAPTAATLSFGPVATPLSDGQVLAADPAQLYAPSTSTSFPASSGSWFLASPSSSQHGTGAAVTLPPGPASVCGTNCGKALLIGPGSGAELYAPEPTIADVAPPNGSGNGGTTVTITGTGLASVTKVTFGGVLGTSLAHDPAHPDTTLTVVTPPNPTGAAGGVEVLAYGPGGRSSPSGSFTYDTAWTGPAATDFTGDSASDRSVYRPSTGQFIIQGASPEVAQYGSPGDVPVPADYNGDGVTDRAVYRPSTGQWFIQGGSPEVIPYGAACSSNCTKAGDIPVPADYNGDGKADIAVYRPSTGQWFIRGGSPEVVQYGLACGACASPTDIPVPGDYNGDGFADIAIYRMTTGQWFIRGGPEALTYGAVGDRPVPADYNGDHATDIAVFRPSTGQWFVRGGSPEIVQYGLGGACCGDVPVPADYNGDGQADIAVFRRSTGQWFVRSGSPEVTPYGNSTDLPLPLPYAIRIFTGLPG